MVTKRSLEESDAESSDRGNDLPNKEADLGEPHHTTLMTLENFLEHSRLQKCGDAAALLLARALCMCARLCVSVSRSKADMSSGEETLEIGYCITGAIYLFWGLTYLIPPLNPIGVNSLAFQMCNAEGVKASSLF